MQAHENADPTSQNPADQDQQEPQQPVTLKSIFKFLFKVGVFILAFKGGISYLEEYHNLADAKKFDQGYLGKTVGKEITTPLQPPIEPWYTTYVADNPYLVVDTVLNTNGFAAPYCAYIRVRNVGKLDTLKGSFLYNQSAPLIGDYHINFSLAPGEWKVMVPYYKKDLSTRRYMIFVDFPKITEAKTEKDQRPSGF